MILFGYRGEFSCIRKRNKDIYRYTECRRPTRRVVYRLSITEQTTEMLSICFRVFVLW